MSGGGGGGGGGGLRRRPRLSGACILLIVVSGMERFVFKGVASNMVTYLTEVMKMGNSAAAKTVNTWCGFTSMLPLLVAPLADSYWDRYSTILASAFLYVMGLVALTSTALARSWSPANTTSSFLFSSLYLISLGQGGYNPSLQAFGADQLDHDVVELPTDTAKTPSSSEQKPKKKKKKKSLFFQWWYFGVCSGCLLGVTVMSYIQDTFGWVIGFAIPMGAMVCSVAVFACGTKIYQYKIEEEEDGVVKRGLVIMVVELVKASASRLVCATNVVALSKNKPRDDVEFELQESKPLCHESSGAMKSMEENSNMIPKERLCVADKVKLILRLLPIWTLLLMFAVIFQQPATFFTKQGMTMERNIGANFKIPPATLQSSITISIILLMPLYDNVLIPITRLFTRTEKGITVMQRMGIGMFLSTIAMILAALVEAKRLTMTKTTSSLSYAPLSIFWLLPQYIILGVSDIFTVVGMQEFFYSEVPVSMRTTAFALYNSVFGVGSFCSAIMISIVELLTSSDGRPNWFSDDMSKARLDKYYWLLAFCSGLSFVLYVIWCKCCRKRISEEETQY
ncbi:protein NRT1/ PTR FAMILY 5.8-like [Cucurbita pepo subsp. pepo]|uniref:protein NRT1/ PTR FAMILY 5.8-like n=1 Tax=Cucurbita pepo subsp. pepo TaxID=3664 RepID=UPI000C9DA14C|nr:protein NRT1/ PTR FAMILY 5.8-like [Cucurbita pepo subsp. pepo]